MKSEKAIRRGGVSLVLGTAMATVAAQDLPPPAAQVVRQADNPLRWIIEAGKLKSRVKLADTGAAVRPAPPKPVARSAAARAPERATASLPAPAATPAPAAEPVAAAPVDPVVAELPAPAEQLVLELLDGAQPVLPAEIDAQLGADAVLELALIVLADGSVGAVSTLSSTHPQVDEHAIAAVRGWRFKPLPQAQVRQVELVFHPQR